MNRTLHHTSRASNQAWSWVLFEAEIERPKNTPPTPNVVGLFWRISPKARSGVIWFESSGKVSRREEASHQLQLFTDTFLQAWKRSRCALASRDESISGQQRDFDRLMADRLIEGMRASQPSASTVKFSLIYRQFRGILNLGTIKLLRLVIVRVKTSVQR